MRKIKIIKLMLITFSIGLLVACGGDKKDNNATTSSKVKPKSMLKKKIDPMNDKGVGPVKELTLSDEIDQSMVVMGKSIFKKKCTACHKSTKKFIGPAPKGIFKRRNPAWVMNMILNPDVMVKENEAAKKLLMEFNGSPMANQNLTEEEARSVLEYFRTL